MKQIKTCGNCGWLVRPAPEAAYCVLYGWPVQTTPDGESLREPVCLDNERDQFRPGGFRGRFSSHG